MRSLLFHRISLIAIFVIVHVLLFYVFGVRILFDSKRYIDQADLLLSHGSFEEGTQVFYTIPVVLVAFCRWFFPGTVVPFLLLQIAVSAIAVLSLYKATARIFKSTIAAFFTVIVFLVWWDNVQWNTAVMTESIFCSLVCFLFYALVRFQGRAVDWLSVTSLVLLLILTRPTGIVVAIGVCVYLLRYYWHLFESRPGLGVMVLTSLIATAIAGAYGMFSQWDFLDQLEKGNLITYADVVDRAGELQADTKGIDFVESTRHPLIKVVGFIFYNPWYFLKTGAIKVWYLMSATRPYYSWWHNLYSILWLTTVYVFFIIGFRQCKSREVRIAIVSVIIPNCLLVAIGTVDWDNRFYIPMMPGIVLLAGGGIAFIFQKLTSRYKRSH